MNSRNRVLASLSHREPDRIPIDLGSNPSSGISAIAYSNLIQHLDIKNKSVYVFDVVQQLAVPVDEVLNRFGVDVIDIGREFVFKDTQWYDIRLAGGNSAKYPSWFKPVRTDSREWEFWAPDQTCIARMPKNGTFFDQTCFPYIDGYPDNYTDLPNAMNKVLWQAMAHSPWDAASELNFWEKLRQRTLYLRRNTDKALMITCGCNLFEWGTFLRRIDNFMMDLYTDPGEVEKLLDALMELHLSSLQKVCTVVGDVVDIIRFGDDLGMDSGPFMSPQIYRKLFKPRHKILCDFVRKNSRMHTLLHSCGSIYQLIPDLIDVGYDILNPVQTNCADMDAVRLKKEFGDDVTFWGGGCDTRFVLNNASPREVADHVRRQIDIFAPGGGFIFNPIHNILPDVCPENIVAMFDTALNHVYSPALTENIKIMDIKKPSQKLQTQEQYKSL